MQAIVRRAFAAGAAAYVVHRGDAERGTLFLKVSTLDGMARLLGPPLASFTGSSAHARAFEDQLAPSGSPERDVDAHMRRQREFDPDLWLVEIEDRAGRIFLDE